jgi:hypothetical protein
MRFINKIDDTAEIDRRKNVIRSLWAGQRLDRIPVHMRVSMSKPSYPVREQFLDADKQLEVALGNANLTWAMLPDIDSVPSMRPDIGCSGLATAFGAKLFWGDDCNQTCGIKEPVIKNIRDVVSLEMPDCHAGQLGEGIERIEKFAQAGAGMISISLLDIAGGLNVANDLLGSELLYTAMVDHPEELKILLHKIQDFFIEVIEAQITAAGGEDAIATFDFPDLWFPEGQKGHVSDDISANISPDMYRMFSTEFHDRIFQRFGGGGLHNCGPNPCLECYLEHTPAPRAIDLAYKYSKRDWNHIKRLCKNKAIVYIWEFPSEPPLCIDTFRELMEYMTPDVIAIPIIEISDSTQNIELLCRKIQEIAAEYAKRMDWGWR